MKWKVKKYFLHPTYLSDFNCNHRNL